MAHDATFENNIIISLLHQNSETNFLSNHSQLSKDPFSCHHIFTTMGCFENHTHCSWIRQIDRSLRIAVCGGDLRKVARLVALGADVNSSILAAVSLASINIVLFLLKQGANPNISRHGTFPLHVATVKGRCAVVQMLLEYGAFPDARTGDGTTPLMLAAQIGNVDIAQLLMTYGARVQMQRASDGFTALHLTCGRKLDRKSNVVLDEQRIVEDPFLLIASVCIEYVAMYDGPTAANTLIEQKSFSGQTALSLALDNQHFNIADLLVLHSNPNPIKKSQDRPQKTFPLKNARKRNTMKWKVSAQKTSISSDRSVGSRHALIGNHTKSLNCVTRHRSHLKEVMQVFHCWRLSN